MNKERLVLSPREFRKAQSVKFYDREQFQWIQDHLNGDVGFSPTPYCTRPVLRALQHGQRRIEVLQWYGVGDCSQAERQWVFPIQGRCECWQYIHPYEFTVQAVVSAEELHRLIEAGRLNCACPTGPAYAPGSGFALLARPNHRFVDDERHYRIASIIQLGVSGELITPRRFVRRRFDRLLVPA